MGERETPALVSKALDAKRKAQERARMGAEAHRTIHLLEGIVRTSIHQLELDLPKHDPSQDDGLLISFSFPFEEADDTVSVTITNIGYPKEDYRVGIEQLPNITASRNDYEGVRVSAPGSNPLYPLSLDELEFNELNELLVAIQVGLLIDGNMRPELVALHSIPRGPIKFGP